MLRSLFAAAVLGLTLTVAGHPTATADTKADAKQPNYVHVVIFNLKKDAPKGEDKAIIEDTHELLAKIPSVKGIRVGAPAEKGTPDLASKDYQLGLVVLVDDFDGLKAYLDHPLHLKFVEKHLKHLEKPVVYDFVQSSK